MQEIVLSALLQLQQTWLSILKEAVQFEDLMILDFDNCSKMIAHCMDTEKQQLANQHIYTFSNHSIVMGPEDDFTPKEIGLALEKKIIPVSLG